MNEIAIFILGITFGGLIAAVIAAFYLMYCKEKFSAKIREFGSETISQLKELERKSIEQLNQIDQESKDRYKNLVEDIEKNISKVRQGGIKT